MVFVTAATTKVLEPRQFAGTIRGYQFVPSLAADVIGWVLPYIELIVGVGLILGYQSRLAAVIALALLTTFVAVSIAAIVTKRNLNCACFGLLYRERIGRSTLLRDAVLLALAGLVYLRGHDLPTIGGMATRSSIESSFGILISTLTLLGALCLGWVACKGWPRWVARLRSSS